MLQRTSPNERPDLLYGYAEIADHLGLSERQLKHLAEKGGVPVFNIGRRRCALRSRLDQWLASKAEGADGQRS